jgi:hypothetical protein
MFFRRESPKAISFAERVEALRQAGFVVAPAGGGVQVSRGGCAVVVREVNGAPRIAQRAGILAGGEIANLVDGGFQKFFRTPSGKSKPALAADLRALHDFEEDLKEALGLESLYNESLGTVSTFYQYDRLQGR